EFIASALSRLSDGDAFERFAQAFLAAAVGQQFEPVGGLHDRGIDGLEHTFADGVRTTTVYQASVDKAPRQKIRWTLKALQDNQIASERLIYVTSQTVGDPERLVDALWDEFQIPVSIRDCRWFQANVNSGQGTLAAYRSFIDNNFHEFDRPGKSVE